MHIIDNVRTCTSNPPVAFDNGKASRVRRRPPSGDGARVEEDGHGEASEKAHRVHSMAAQTCTVAHRRESRLGSRCSPLVQSHVTHSYLAAKRRKITIQGTGAKAGAGTIEYNHNARRAHKHGPNFDAMRRVALFAEC